MLATPAISAHMLGLMTTRFNRVIVSVGGQIRSLYPDVFNVDTEIITANPFYEKLYSGLGTMPAKPEGTQFKMDNIIEGGTVTVYSVPWGKGFEYTREAMMFDLYKMYDDITGDLTRAAFHRQEVTAWGVFNDAFVGGTYVGYDGLSLCNASHPYLDPALGVQSNMSDTDISLSVAGLQIMRAHFDLLEDERGMPDDMRRPKLILIHPSKIPTARIVLGSIYNPTDATNAVNPIVDDDYKYFPVRYFTSTTAWFAMCDPSLTGLHVQFAQHPLPGNYVDPRNLSLFNTLYQNFAVWFNIWRGVWGSRGTGA